MTASVQNLLADAEILKEQLVATKLQIGRPQGGPTLNKPNTFSGKPETLDAWVSHMDQGFSGTDPLQAFAVATKYLQGDAFGWYQSVTAKRTIADWPSPCDAVIHGFHPLNKEEAPQNLLHKRRQVKDEKT